MSTGKTTYLGLHRWEPDDDFLRTEFNENSDKLDSELQAMQREMEAEFSAVREEVAEHDHDAGDITAGILAVARGGTGVASLAELATQLGAAKIESGVYTGTNTYGSSNPTRITFSFDPKIIFVVKNMMSNMGTANGTIIFYRATPNSFATHSVNTTNKPIYVSYSNKTLSFYSTDTSVYQQNGIGDYSYVAIG